MNLPRITLLVSLAANLALAALLVSRARDSRSAAAAPPAAPVSSAPSLPPPPPVNAKTWASLSAGSEADLVARLRAEDFPPRIVRALALARLQQRFAVRRAALREEGRAPAYWRSQVYETSTRPARDPKIRAQLRALDNEYLAAQRQLLGDDADAPSDQLTESRRRRYGDLPPDKIRQLEAIDQDYGELRSQVRGETLGIVFPEDQTQLDLLDQERRADLERTLSPAELEAYDLRNSTTARDVRNQLAAFKPTEAEFRALVKIQQAYDLRYKGQNLTADESREAREAMVATVLTPQRLAEYAVTTAGAYQPVSRLVEQLKLPPSTVADVINVQRDIMRRVGVVNNDATLTTTQRDAQLAVLAREATDKLTASLGESGLDNYRTSIAGWLQRLPTPAPAPEAPKP